MLLSVLLVAAVLLAGYMTYQNRALVSSAELVGTNAKSPAESDAANSRVVELEAQNAELSAESDAANSRVVELEAQNAELSAQIDATENRYAEQLRADVEAFKQDMSVELSRRDGEIQQLRDATTTIQLGSDVVFNPSSTRLSSAGREVLSKVTGLIENYPGYLVSLEGHTDNVPIKLEHQGRFPSNWELSADRAAAAARFLVNQGVAPQRLKVVGYGFSRPLTENYSEQGRAQNRRLEIRFSPEPRIRVTQ